MKIENIDARRINIQILSLEYEEQQELVDEITDARDSRIIIDVIKKDEKLFKTFIGVEFFDEQITKEEKKEFNKRLREAMYSSPDEIAKLMKLRAPSKKEVDELDGQLLGLKLTKQRFELEEASLFNSELFYWVYLVFSTFLGLLFTMLGLFSWRKDEGTPVECDNELKSANNSMQKAAKASDD